MASTEYILPGPRERPYIEPSQQLCTIVREESSPFEVGNARYCLSVHASLCL